MKRSTTLLLASFALATPALAASPSTPATTTTKTEVKHAMKHGGVKKVEKKATESSTGNNATRTN